MTNRDYFITAGWVFGLVAILHLVRLIQGWDFILNGWVVPIWVSALVILVMAYMSWTAFKKKNH